MAAAEGRGDAPGMTRQNSGASLTSGAGRLGRAMAAAGTLKRNMSFTGLRSSRASPGASPGASPDVSPTASPAPSEAGDQWETASNVSTTSRVSKVSNLIAGMKSVARSTASRAMPTPCSAGLAQDVAVGECVVTVALVTVRRGEELESEEVCKLPSGTPLTILEIVDRRIRVAASGCEGWISKTTKFNEPLVKRRPVSWTLEEPEVGAKYQAGGLLAVHTEESLGSEVKAKLKAGALLTVVEKSVVDRYRVKVTGPTVTGWISLIKADGSMAVAAASASGKSSAKEVVVLMPKYVKIKALLEGAVQGDVEAIRRVHEGKGSWFSSSTAERPSLNCVDVRGKTPLMYAAGLGHTSVVEFLLGRDEVDVHALDDTRKSALHHASKRGRARRPHEHAAAQAQIVAWLLEKGAQTEAKDQNGCTAIMFAVANGDEAVAKTLVAARACVNVQDLEGHTPLDYAVNFQQHALVDLLRSNGGLGQIDRSAPGSEEECLTEAPGSPRRLEEVPGGEAPKLKLRKKKSALPATSDETVTDEAADDGTDKKLKKKRVVKVVKTVKKDSKEVSAGMMEAAANQEEVQVAVEAVPEAAEEVVDERARALAKLSTLLASGPSAGELDAALKAAEAAGADDAELAEAHAVLQALLARDRAREALRQAALDRDVPRLQAALLEAQAAGVAGPALAEAQAVLAREEPRHQARERLAGARESGSLPELKAALAEARRVGLDAAELADFEALLRGAESKEKAEAALRAAIQGRGVAELKFALQQARDAGVDAELVKSATAILSVEEPKHEARQLLAAACEKNDVKLLQEAIAAATAAVLEGEELLAQAREQLRREERKAALLGAVRQAIQDCAGIDMTNIDSIREGKDRLSAAIDAAIAAGAPEAELMEAEIKRKKLHNAVEDLKGSIRVFCRVRPLSSKEKEQGDEQAVQATGAMSLQVEETPFQFDAVFTPGTQEEVFEDCRDLVQSAVDGYNVTMFAYGQTGAGKTFTMYGCPGAEGTAPRTIEELFRVIERRKHRCSYTVMGSMLELYRNDLVDLLSKANPSSSKSKLNVKVDKAGFVSVENLIEEECRSAEELRALLHRGEAQRSVAATAMNSESSRSHLVLMITIVSVNYETKERLRGKVLICDLAGSERLKKSQVSEDMQKEAIEINKSLTALGDVIENLTSGSKVIPYRNHKLTQLMQDALGGSAKTLMFVNCSPASSNAQETLMSLKYATRAKKITNTAKKGA